MFKTCFCYKQYHAKLRNFNCFRRDHMGKIRSHIALQEIKVTAECSVRKEDSLQGKHLATRREELYNYWYKSNTSCEFSLL